MEVLVIKLPTPLTALVSFPLRQPSSWHWLKHLAVAGRNLFLSKQFSVVAVLLRLLKKPAKLLIYLCLI